MIVYYSINEDDSVYANELDMFNYDSKSDGDLKIVAKECAYEYHENCDGRDMNWPVEIYLYDSNKTPMGVYEVDREFDPVFFAKKLQRQTLKHKQLRILT